MYADRRSEREPALSDGRRTLDKLVGERVIRNLQLRQMRRKRRPSTRPRWIREEWEPGHQLLEPREGRLAAFRVEEGAQKRPSGDLQKRCL